MEKTCKKLNCFWSPRRKWHLQILWNDQCDLVQPTHDKIRNDYEVEKGRNKHSVKVAQIVKECMENAMDLSVPFPVKVKIGPSWRQLVEMCKYDWKL